MAMALRWLRQLPPLLHNSSSGLVRPPLRVPLRHTALMLNGCRQCVVHQTMLTRHLATKKAKAKGKGQTQARVNINAALVEDIVSLGEVNGEMQAVVEALQEEFGKNLTIRTSPGALDHITVTTKDGKFPLNQLGQISLKSPQLIIVNMASFPENTAAAIKAIRESGMNLNPEVDGIIIRVPVPKSSKWQTTLQQRWTSSWQGRPRSSLADCSLDRHTVSSDYGLQRTTDQMFHARS
ncbi:ribosome-recycling factor, mitochondrial isoform X2 [Mauremys mutica]|uniref:ribosome-recycling factor, mitochondrial isoform X2 n=1 Tax=Mauremys mutica TaxID=74926 RepID=UPI001D1689E6|nr:ribosome-recycling factor, mitochondrial isoform X2 [Mauremys mutica]